MNHFNFIDYKYIDHIAYIFQDIEAGYNFFKAHKSFRILHGPGINKTQGVRFMFVEVDSIGKIEILAPISEESPINNILSKTGSGLYHICYAVSNIEESIQILEECGWKSICSPTSDIAFAGRKIAFSFNKSIGLIELVEADINIKHNFDSLELTMSSEHQLSKEFVMQPKDTNNKNITNYKLPKTIIDLLLVVTELDAIPDDIQDFSEIKDWDSLSIAIFHTAYEESAKEKLNMSKFQCLSDYINHYNSSC